MKRVLTVGVFDLLHWGHFELFRRCKELAGAGGKLIVAVQEDAVVTRYKPQARLVYDWDKRVKMIRALRYVDDVVPYTDIDESIKGFDFDVFAIGGDQLHDGFNRAVKWCEKNKKKVVRLARTSGVSSTQIRNGHAPRINEERILMNLGEDKFGLGMIWTSVFCVYEEFAKVCDENKLRYYVSDGCALGAVRHGGFIPWDDDLDVSMPRPDYERFLELAGDALPPHLKLVTWRNMEQYNGLMAKIQDSREEVVSRIEKAQGAMLSNGIYIDILPIDGAATSTIGRFVADKWFRLRRVMMRFCCERFSRQTTKGKIYWLAGALIYPFFPHLWGRRRLLESYEQSAKANSYDHSSLTIRPCSNVSYRKPPVAKTIWGVPIRAKFGEKIVMLPEHVDSYLTSEYGNYMKWPPVQCQRPGHQYPWRCPWWLGPTKTGGNG